MPKTSQNLPPDPYPSCILTLDLAKRANLDSSDVKLYCGLHDCQSNANIPTEGALLGEQLRLRRVSAFEFRVARGQGDAGGEAIGRSGQATLRDLV